MCVHARDPPLPPRQRSCLQREHWDQAEQGLARARDEQPPGRGGFSAPSQLSNFPHTAFVRLPKDVLEQPECSEMQPRWERRGLSTSGKGFTGDRTGNATAYWQGSGAGEVVGSRVFWRWGESSTEVELARGARAQRGARRTHGDGAGSGRTGKSSIQKADNGRVLFPSRRLPTNRASRICPVA